ncbi:MAG: methionyl-tRNA formyltransferase [Bacteroidetes bacterium]|nr:MAG: methionyl-tRNA formyltransferase [Bacteroidota bacterium]
MGTPEFAVPSLEILLDHGYNVAAVVTATDKYGGRGNKKLIESAVKKFAVSRGLRVLQPKNLKAPEFVETLRELKPDLQVVVAFRMLPEVVWSLPTIGTFNLHGSLLPKYRGAAPINWAIMNGEKETGVTTFFLKHEIDTGDVLMQEKMPIGENETAGEVHDRMMKLGAEVVLKTVKMIEQGDYVLRPQDDTAATKAPKIFHETCEINFDQPTQKVHDFIRGLSPYPGAWTILDGKEMKILRTTKEIVFHNFTPGQMETDQKNYLRIATRDGFVQVLELKVAGKRQMNIRDFLNGYKF